MGIPEDQYLRMLEHVMQVQRHFLVNDTPKRYDIFNMIIHSIWLRRLNSLHLIRAAYLPPDWVQFHVFIQKLSRHTKSRSAQCLHSKSLANRADQIWS
ncbi:hypothetical protein QQP08_003449 [Theobroma cacao]|nr:hypothetical protein QQP08_003449 [Theobroma cacao]